MPSLLDKVKGKLGIKKQPRGHKLGGDDYACQQREGEKPKQKRQLSDQEKEARRDAMAAAAANREKAWEKKISKSAHARRQEEKRKEREIENNFTEEEAVKSEATLRSVEEAKRSEQQLANAMGYNPYQPVMSSTMKGGVGGTTAKSENLTPPGPLVRNSSDSSATSKHSHAGFDEDVKVQLATALEYLLNQSLNGVCDGTISQIQTVFPNPDDAALFESGKLCINTVVKMLTNVASNPGEPKFRSIRLNNKNFSSKVAEVEGGLELILSAGFVLVEVEAEQESNSVAGTYLKHAGEKDIAAMRQLDFTLSILCNIASLF